MNHKNGFVLLHRKIFNSSDFKNQLDISIFIYLMAMASHESCEVIYRGKKIFLNRGEVCIAERDLAKKFDLTKSKVKSIIKRLINNHNIYQRMTKRLSVYAIVKYEKYQSLDSKNDHKTTINSTTEQLSKLNKSNTSIYTNKQNIINMKKIDIKSFKPKLKSLNQTLHESKDEFQRAFERGGQYEYEQLVKKKLADQNE